MTMTSTHFYSVTQWRIVARAYFDCHCFQNILSRVDAARDLERRF